MRSLADITGLKDLIIFSDAELWFVFLKDSSDSLVLLSIDYLAEARCDCCRPMFF